MHLALISDPHDPLFAPEPHSTLDQRSVYQSMRNVVGLVLRHLRTDLWRFGTEERRLAELVTGKEQELLRRFDVLLSRKIHSVRTRIHGDMHLDQILFDGRDFTIVDFEGDRQKSIEERRRKRSPLRDVARMTRSFHYAAEVALSDESRVRPADRERAAPWAKVWRTAASVVFIRAWMERVRGTALLPPDNEELATLLDVFAISKALKELGDELSGNATLVRIPLAALAEDLNRP
jgi:maltose alpha-D-glucosyltransferase/alpha-amylase